MTKLSDRSIRHQMYAGRLIIEVPRYVPLMDGSQFQSASVDVRLGEVSNKAGVVVGLRGLTVGYWLEPYKFMLGSTMELIGLPPNIVGSVKGKSTRAREGLKVQSAGHVDPGFQGELTLELFNMDDEPLLLTYGMRIAQVVFDWMDGDAERPYGHDTTHNHYQGQTGPTPAAL